MSDESDGIPPPLDEEIDDEESDAGESNEELVDENDESEEEESDEEVHESDAGESTEEEPVDENEDNDPSYKYSGEIQWDSSESEDEALPLPETIGLSWRLDPKESHSDWTIEIITIGSSGRDGSATVSQRYHVHKTVLGIGSKKSEYFSRIFQNNSFAEAATHTSRIELHELATKAFPVMLDYVYSCDDTLNATTENSTALRHLARYFEVKALQREVKKFYKQDLTFENCGLYYEHAKAFYDENITKAVKQLCFDNISMVQQNSNLLKVSDASLWLEILPHATEAESERDVTGDIVAEFCSTHQDEVDYDVFIALTSRDCVGESISWWAALKLLELEAILVSDTDPNELSDLQTRCIDSMSFNWPAFDEADDWSSKLSPLVLASLLQQSLQSAKGDKEELEASAKEDFEKLKASAEEEKEKLEASVNEESRKRKATELKLAEAEEQLSGVKYKLKSHAEAKSGNCTRKSPGALHAALVACLDYS